MATILNIETSTEICSCALSQDSEVLFSRVSDAKQSHASLLGVFAEEIMRFADRHRLTPDAIAVSSGPGSYTGLRIGVSEAKGLAYGLNVPLIAVPTHRIMASAMLNGVETNTLLCPMIDARRMEVYSTVFDTKLNVVRETSADIIDENSYSDLLEKHRIVFFGNGAAKTAGIIKHPNAVFADGGAPLASSMAFLAEKAFQNKEFEDIAYFEPFYLKEFIAVVAKNKVLS